MDFFQFISSHMKKKRSHSESVVFFSFFFINQSKTENDRESRFGLDYQKLSMGSEGDDPGIGTFALIYWNHFLEPGLILFHINLRFRIFLSPICFLDASTHLYKRLCPSVGRLVGWLVGHILLFFMIFFL